MQNYCEYHVSDDYRVLRYIVEKKAPEYYNAFNYIFEHEYRLNPYNMFLMRWEDFDAYCSWLFPLLDEVEQCISVDHYSVFQQRVFGFMAERLFNVWLLAENKNKIEKPIIFISEDIQNQQLGPRKLYRHFSRNIRYSLINYLYNKP